MATKMKTQVNNLILEANRINYSLRSTFFFRKLRDSGYFEVLRDIDNLAKEAKNYSWEDKKFWNITHNAWDLIAAQRIEYLRVFCHPKILVEHSKLISYYRNVAAIPLKGVQYLAFNVTNYENRKKPTLAYQNAMALAKLFNTHISAIVESTLSITLDNINSLMYSSAGCTVDGSWRNKIGEEAEKMVESYILRACLDRDAVSSLIDKSDSPVAFDKNFDYIANVALFKGIKLKNRKAILFSSEPDVSVIDETGKPLSVIEVKGGADPAGALERLGAIKKSFDQARKDNAQVETILVVSCVTKEMDKRLRSDKLIGTVFNLTSIITDMDYRDSFINKVSRILGFPNN